MRLSEWRSRSKKLDLTPCHDKSRTGHCGGVGPLRKVEEPICIISISRAGKVGAPAPWGSFARTVGKRKNWMKITRLDLLAPYQGAARDERKGKTQPQEDVTKRNLGNEGKVTPVGYLGRIALRREQYNTYVKC
jgi:hypothetical protein